MTMLTLKPTGLRGLSRHPACGRLWFRQFEHAAHTARWYLTDNGYFVTPDTIPATAITAVTIIASGQRVFLRITRPLQLP